MDIRYGGIKGKLTPGHRELKNFQDIRTHFSVEDPNKWAAKSFREGWWDGRHYVISKDGVFLRGLSPLILKYAQSKNVSISEINPHPSIAHRRLTEDLIQQADTETLSEIILQPHQRRMVRSLLQRGGGTVEGVTGCGKTESILLLMKILSSKVSRMIVLVHRSGLMEQSYRRFTVRCPELASLAGMLGDGKRPEESDRVVFCTYQSLKSALDRKNPIVQDLYKNIGAVIIDECHNVSQPSYIKTIEKIPMSCMVYQFSGTPETNDQIRDWTIVGVGGEICERVRRSELESTGFIAYSVAFLREF